MMRRFEFVEGKSAKFWQISRTGKTIEIRFGRIGANGQLLKQVLPDDAAAIRHADKLIGDKLTNGYSEVRVSTLA
jgi:predicted DNA-binding WGR domain protein